jgi:hypothetical protein
MTQSYESPTRNTYVWDDVVSTVLSEEGLGGVELESHEGYVMLESWFGNTDADQFDEDLLAEQEVISQRLKMRRISSAFNWRRQR